MEYVGLYLKQVLYKMRQRCNNTKDPKYVDYGKRGIKICKEWMVSSKAFVDWALSSGFKPGLQIDRINNNEGYNPNNCRWVTRTTNTQNTRKRKDNTSGYRGVSFSKKSNRYFAGINVNNKKINIGYYDTALEAAKAYDYYITVNNLSHTKNNVLLSNEKVDIEKILGIRNKSGYRGVSWHNASNAWMVTLTQKRKQIYLGTFKNKKQAALIREKYILENCLTIKRNFNISLEEVNNELKLYST